MNNRTSKKQLILHYAHIQNLQKAGALEIAAIERQLRCHLGPRERTSPSYIANTLQQVGIRIEYDDRYVDLWMQEPYTSQLTGVLEFKDLESAQRSLQKLDAIYREYRAKTDRAGTMLVRRLVTKGKQRAESVAANPRVRPSKRREKAEIARWFRVWLEVPDLFFDWLELRQQSEEYRLLFWSPDGRANKSSPTGQQ